MAHLPVLFEEVLLHLRPEPGDVIFDATAGGGGHAGEILKRIGPSGKLIAVDRDAEAMERIMAKFKELNSSLTCVNDDFRNIRDILGVRGISTIDGALFDLGVSSYHLDDGSRGFSFLKDGPLDMRFDTRGGISARDVVNTYSQDELRTIIKDFGEERHALLVARRICSARKAGAINTTGELAKIVDEAVGSKYRHQRLHLAARTFQALRIFVNDELAAVREGAAGAIDYLRPGARICVISFHSLEDRIVKNIFRDKKKEGHLDIVTKKPLGPGFDEIRNNPRSRSAKLRVAEKKI
ncbi:MAG: 16S rRNA (cytosine(1402)-N(4))-methyltransferase RsmH [Candidatus Omnitrophica bacterium]|nr:16S rRNA (cytosine(1402)-N(4))-methyltransferase RsmH [Candidatus Omnitrophota bacterium]MBU1128818.1 16S rRNA (cytosine(1402)-N(4))-methyltransferase RsmH [Candidatus Omnitrophota bacterium]MBU1656656.1 16S rRNA (cytosine(1402)-N(4))-methyltransferase RsmH [Candidatus Omnitrophota bacterium]MBU1783789.1 16S rRNA (cytosine(1402)-N(4))-methyltransferase RsmH [Candidatus Omnitrophota bacterium]MBU1851189.1 16S rRNA (cytosine(1402)-N(4))-methyltransferase RsmH [Candidatus Omnitrophota bacterium